MTHFFLFIVLLFMNFGSQSLVAEVSTTDQFNNITISCEKGEIKCVAKFNSKSYDVLIGKNGLSDNKLEGDGTTPIGSFSLSKEIFYRSDKIPKPVNQASNQDLEFIAIKDNFGWCNDPESPNYNKFMNLDEKNSSFESLKRDDSKYDLIIPINYNVNPTIPDKGSAIFIYLQQDNQTTGTLGCVAFKKKDLIEIIEKMREDTMIVIGYS